jgi:F like protein
MATVPLQTLEQLDVSAEEFEALVMEGLNAAAIAVMNTEDIERALRNADPTALDAILAFWAAYVGAELLPALDVNMIAAGTEVIAGLAEAVGNPLTLLADQALDTELYLQQARNRLVGIGDELWVNARAALAEGTALGESIPQLAARVRAAVGVTEPRARMIARTEVHGARNTVALGTMIGFETTYGIESGVINKQWQAALDERTRPTHVVADNQVVAMSSPFVVGEAFLAFPGDPSGPAGEVINCRCATFAVFDPADLDLNDNGTVITLNAAAIPEEADVPWRIEPDNVACAEGQYAVVKEEDGEVEGCHDTRESALEQLAALYASESENAAPMARNVAPWSGVIVVEGAPAYDGQEYAVGSLTWPELGATESLEIPLGWKYERAHGGVDNGNTVDVGRVDHIERIGNEIHARGVLDLDSPWGREAARQMGTRMDPGFLAGISIIDDSGNQGDIEVVLPEGCEELPVDAEGSEVARCMTAEKVIYHSGRIRSADLVSIPAFVEARVYLDDGAPIPTGSVVSDMPEEMVTASAYTITIPDLPPADWFDEPKEVPEIGAITVTDDGRFFGYLAPKQVAHRGYRDKRVTVPTGNVDYGIWMNRATMVDDGSGSYAKIATGPITMDCGHASMGPKGAARREHYDNACSVVATARVGENARGVWIAGALIPGVNADQVARMMACQLSGDWGPHRERPGKRELAAALLVPVPGFPTRSRSFTLRSGELARTVTPIRFGTRAGVDEPIGIRAAVDRIAAQVGLDRESKMREFAFELRKVLKGDE